MGDLLSLKVVQAGQCMVTPAQIGLVTEISVALLLLEQPKAGTQCDCSCHAADLRNTEVESRILITDCEGNQHVFRILTTVLRQMLQDRLLRVQSDGVTCTRLQGTILKSTEKGNARAAMIRRLGRL